MTTHELSILYDDILDMIGTATGKALDVAPGTEFAKSAVALQEQAEYTAAHAADFAEGESS